MFTAPPLTTYDEAVVAKHTVSYPPIMLVDRIYTSRHTLEIVQEAVRRYARRYVSYSASIRDGNVEHVDRADQPLDITPLPVSGAEAASYIATRLPDLQVADCAATLAALTGTFDISAKRIQ